MARGAGTTNRKTSRGDVVDEDRKRLSSRAERFPKTLFALSRCKNSESEGSGDLLSRSTVHAEDRDGVGYGGGAAADEAKP